MPRKRLIRTSQRPYHIVNQCDNREAFPGSLDLNWSIFSHRLFEAQLIYGFKVHAFVLMPNHFHLMASFPDQPIDEVMRWISLSITKDINLALNRCGHLFRGKYKWSLINDQCYLENVLRYIYQNPVRSNIVSHAQNYRFSSLRYVLGLDCPRYQLTPSYSQFEIGPTLERDVRNLDLISGRPQDQQTIEVTRKALRKSIFTPGAVRASRKRGILSAQE